MKREGEEEEEARGGGRRGKGARWPNRNQPAGRHPQEQRQESIATRGEGAELKVSERGGEEGTAPINRWRYGHIQPDFKRATDIVKCGES